MTAESVTPGLVPQPHGGALYTGGVPGNRGGIGRPKSVIRARMRQHLDDELIEATLKDWQGGKLKSLEVAEFFAKYGVGTQTETLDAEDVQRMASAVLDCFRRIAEGWGIPQAEIIAKAKELAQAATLARGDG